MGVGTDFGRRGDPKSVARRKTGNNQVLARRAAHTDGTHFKDERMALSSQSPRSDIRPDRSGGRAPGPLSGMGARVGLVGGAFIIAGLGLIGIWKFAGTAVPQAAKAMEQAAPAPTGTGTQPKTEPAKTEPKPIDMGKPNTGTLVPAPTSVPRATAPASSGPSVPPAGGAPGTSVPNVNPAGENKNAPTVPVPAKPGTTPQPSTNQPLPADGAAGPGSGTGSEGNTPGGVRALVDEAGRALAAGRPLEARALLNTALLDSRLPGEERKALRAQIAAMNETLIFSPAVSKGDPLTDVYAIAAGDSLVTLTRKQGLPVDWRFIQRINQITNPGGLRIGQKIKVVRAPFHAVIHKSDYRMDVYMGDPLPPSASIGREMGPDGQDPSWTFVRSFSVGLGESNGTPEGAFVVRPKSKLTNPRWVNPRTGEVFEPDNPRNPIGEHWLGLDGVDEGTRKFTGYGIHGTIDAASVGKQMSMGCVRMNADDIAVVYEVLVERISTVKIVK